MLGRVLYRKVPAPPRVKNKLRGPRGKAAGPGGGHKVENLPVFFLNVKQGNSVDPSPVPGLTAALGVKDGPVKQKRGAGVL
jgi:hypothetical protein